MKPSLIIITMIVLMIVTMSVLMQFNEKELTPYTPLPMSLHRDTKIRGGGNMTITTTATSTIAYVSSSQGTCSTVCTGSIIDSATLNVTTGKLIVVLIGGYNGGASMTVTGVTDTAGNTYVQGTSCFNNAQLTAGITDIWYAKNVTGNASNVVTVTYSSSTSTYRSVFQMQYSGADTTSPFEVCAIGNTASGTTVTSASFSPASSKNVNVAIGNASGAVTWTAGTNYTSKITSSGPDRIGEDRTNSPAGSQTASATVGSAFNLEISVASFKPLVTTTTSGSSSVKIRGGGAKTSGSILLKQAVVRGSDLADPDTQSYGSTVTINDLLVVIVNNQSASTPTVTDTLGNTWSSTAGITVSNLPTAGDTSTQTIFYAIAKSSGADTVTATGGGNRTTQILLEYTGTASSNVFDTSVTETSQTSSSPSVGIVPANTGELIVAGMMSGVSVTSAGSGFTLRTSGQSANNFSSAEDSTSTTAGVNINAAYTLSAGGFPNGMSVAGFKPQTTTGNSSVLFR